MPHTCLSYCYYYQTGLMQRNELVFVVRFCCSISRSVCRFCTPDFAQSAFSVSCRRSRNFSAITPFIADLIAFFQAPTHSCCPIRFTHSLFIYKPNFSCFISFIPITHKFIIIFLNLLNLAPCSGFVMKSATISSVGQYSTSSLFFSIQSLIKNT